MSKLLLEEALMSFEFIENGSPTSAAGFLASGVTAGFKRSGAPDFAMVVSENLPLLPEYSPAVPLPPPPCASAANGCWKATNYRL